MNLFITNFIITEMHMYKTAMSLYYDKHEKEVTLLGISYTQNPHSCLSDYFPFL